MRRFSFGGMVASWLMVKSTQQALAARHMRAVRRQQREARERARQRARVLRDIEEGRR